MILAGAAALLLLAFGAAEDQRQAARPVQEGPPGLRHHIIIRVTTGLRRAPAPGAALIEGREGRGPRCIVARRIVAAARPRQDRIDFILRDRTRIRARLDRRCPAIDFYGNLYVRPTEDGQICADRDVIRSRTGGECQIDQFRSLTAHAR
jgi:hypothetical protein